ncbi:uncharacterized protein LOC123503035 isoform X2 [Portunus trituberculatus]|uniref:uncharacterized protein LOC123503035 isoform X2 n=1 Tax=Portunus trituberculatus TaxID=210409 RepID=UPI001E1D1A5E|nr:uncharacterized protein LOC123503035 isoform X2 [Portunus trituberculatus]
MLSGAGCSKLTSQGTLICSLDSPCLTSLWLCLQKETSHQEQGWRGAGGGGDVALHREQSQPNTAATTAGCHQEQQEERSNMPEEALDGDTEGRSRDDRKESEEDEEASDIARKKDSDSEVEISNENLKDTCVKCELVDFDGIKEGNEDDDDGDDNDYSEGEDSWLNRVQRRRNEEEKDYVWLRVIDKETYLKVMAPVYLLLEARSASPLHVHHVRLAVSHLSRIWPWWAVGVRHRGQERTPWLCVTPAQRPTLQVSGVDEEEDENELWNLIDEQQWRHTKVAEGMLSSITLITHSRLSAAAAAVAAAPHAHRNEDKVPGTSGNPGHSNPTTPSMAEPSQVQRDNIPDLPHKVYLMLGVPCSFVEHVTATAICRTFVTLLDDVLAGRIQEEHKVTPETVSPGEVGGASLESWLAERLEMVAEVKAEGSRSNTEPDGGYPRGEENEDNEYDSWGYMQRAFDSVTSRNFINRCKAERVSYVNGFATCVSAAAAAILTAAAAEERGDQQRQVVTRQRVCEHLRWPAAPLDWQDDESEQEVPPDPCSRPPGVTITAPAGEDSSVFWEAARCVSQQRWGTPAAGKRGATLHILHALVGEEGEDDVPLQRYPTVSLHLCDIQKDESSILSVQRAGNVVGLGPHSLSPLRHFLITHTVNLHLEEATQVLSFSLHHSTLFLSPGTGKRFADEIETALKNSLRQR